MKYFYALNANRTIAGVEFDLVGVLAGTVVGVYATDKPETITALEALSGSGVLALTEEEYQLKKKAVRISDFSAPPSLSVRSPGVPIKAGGVLLDAGRPSSSDVEITPEDALKVAAVNLPPERRRGPTKKPAPPAPPA